MKGTFIFGLSWAEEGSHSDEEGEVIKGIRNVFAVCGGLDDDEKLMRTLCVSGQNRKIRWLGGITKKSKGELITPLKTKRRTE